MTPERFVKNLLKKREEFIYDERFDFLYSDTDKQRRHNDYLMGILDALVAYKAIDRHTANEIMKEEMQ